MALDNRFWKNVTMCLKVVAPLMVDSDAKPTMSFIYEEMENAKEKIKYNFNYTRKSYEPVWKIIDERWDHQLHRPLHVAAYYLNPYLHYEPIFRHDDHQVKEGLHIGLFSMEEAKDSRKVMQPGEWWEMFGDGTPELRRFAIRVLSLTCSSSGCERNWSSFEMVHTKRRNRLHQQKMNDLVYVMYNLKLKSKQNRKNIPLPFDEIEFDDEWITEEGYNDEDEQPQGEGDGGNVELVGDEDLDDDGDGDESDDIHGDDPIRGLDMIL
ncbi:uncharacterized protein LOC114398571 [Glycine soja]|uniref:uncharacterized protein LOC114398571 n=1 Tax=Glycine soja TaxID=3848 RepID=UPI001038A1D1|nr:uncharacterized protein LOC114398571 [Glycine soja]